MATTESLPQTDPDAVRSPVGDDDGVDFAALVIPPAPSLHRVHGAWSTGLAASALLHLSLVLAAASWEMDRAPSGPRPSGRAAVSLQARFETIRSDASAVRDIALVPFRLPGDRPNRHVEVVPMQGPGANHRRALLGVVGPRHDPKHLDHERVQLRDAELMPLKSAPRRRDPWPAVNVRVGSNDASRPSRQRAGASIVAPYAARAQIASAATTGHALVHVPTVVHEVAPTYPIESLARGQSGLVIVRVDIGTDGRVLRATLSRSSGVRALDRAARAAAVSWRFSSADPAGDVRQVALPFEFVIRRALP